MAWGETSNALRLTDVYVEGFRKRLFPVFDDIDSEATAAREDFERNAPVYTEEMLWDAHIDAFEHGWEVYGNLEFVRRQLIDLAIAGLFHLWERLVFLFIFRQLRIAVQIRSFKDICDTLKKLGSKIESCEWFEDLDTLHLVANTIKHGEGRSSKRLARKEPSLFDSAPDSNTADQLDLNVEHFDRFAQAVRSFWTSMHEHFAH
jgi:hypothetical protein